MSVSVTLQNSDINRIRKIRSAYSDFIGCCASCYYLRQVADNAFCCMKNQFDGVIDLCIARDISHHCNNWFSYKSK